MNSEKNTVRLVGVLFLVQMIAAVLSYSVILDPILYTEDYLASVAGDSFLVRTAMILDLIVGLAVFGIAVLLFPILKRFNERIALWYAGLRLTELVSFMIGGALLLTLVSLSHTYLMAETGDAANLQVLAKYMRSARGSMQNISLWLYFFGTSSFYYLLFQSRLVPRFISIWGLIAVLLLFVEINASIFGTSAGGLMIMMPLGLNELFLGVWLIVKGFNNVTPATG